uniref:G protein-coupled receptor n=1 Tax=Steinernema glaseri TaxID=37863 RepID=A0A1I8A6U2_9BILA
MIGKMFNDVAGFLYRLLCMLMLMATFMSFTFPFAAQRIFNPKKRNALYRGGLIFVICQVLYNNIQTMVTVHYKEELGEDLISVWYLSIQVLGASTVFFFLLFYALSVIAILWHAWKSTNLGAKQNNSKLNHRRQLLSVVVYATMPSVLLNHRRQLLSVVVYATMPSVLVIIGQISNIYMLLISALPLEVRTEDNPLIVTGAEFNQLARYISYVRPLRTYLEHLDIGTNRRSDSVDVCRLHFLSKSPSGDDPLPRDRRPCSVRCAVKGNMGGSASSDVFLHVI